ncbi:MAG: iron-containing redox enzyme family protein [Acidimicrobiales bacterium]
MTNSPALVRTEARTQPEARTRPEPVWPALQEALATRHPGALDRLAGAAPVDERDELLCLLAAYDLDMAPLEQLGPIARRQRHPTVIELRNRLEDRLLGRLRTAVPDHVLPSDPDDVVATIRAVAARDLLPPIYDWAADRATGTRLRAFLALEGGPDGGFDDLVALAQVGLAGDPKVELARNYWDEMGRGRPDEVHTDLHRRMARAAGLPRVRREDLPVEALARAVLGPFLATNRWLQPELLGALGLTELQAGPRCRKVLLGLHRTGAPADALPFYEEHAHTDPRHGKDWLVQVVTPLARRPLWAAGLVRGARWRAAVNDRFFAAMARRFGAVPPGWPAGATAGGPPVVRG